MTPANTTQDAPHPADPGGHGGAMADLAADRKALDIVQLDLRGMIGYTDYFVICTGRTDRQTQAIHDAIHGGHEVRARHAAARVEGVHRGAAGF